MVKNSVPNDVNGSEKKECVTLDGTEHAHPHNVVYQTQASQKKICGKIRLNLSQNSDSSGAIFYKKNSRNPEI